MDVQPVDRLVAAALQGQVSQVRAMVTADPGLLSARNMFGAGAVHAARYGGQDAVLAALGDLGLVTDGFLAAELGTVGELREILAASPGFAARFDERGSTALHGAVYWGQREAAELLLDAGADPGAVSRDDFLRIPPLGSAVATTPGIPQPSDDEDTVLGLVRLLLDRGADVNGRRKDGMTALHTAGWRGLARAAQELLDAGADPAITATAGPHRGQAPADTARAQGHTLLAARLDVPGQALPSPHGDPSAHFQTAGDPDRKGPQARSRVMAWPAGRAKCRWGCHRGGRPTTLEVSAHALRDLCREYRSVRRARQAA